MNQKDVKTVEELKNNKETDNLKLEVLADNISYQRFYFFAKKFQYGDYLNQ